MSYPVDKGFCRRLMFTDTEKWWMSPYYFVDPYGQHCINQKTAVMERKGRIWTAWTQPGINGTDLYLSWSGDGGATWHGCQGDGKLPRVHGVSPWAVCLIPYGQGVAVFSRKGHELVMLMAFDDKTWTEPKKYPSLYGQQLFELSDDEIYLCAPTYEPEKIMRFDGVDGLKNSNFLLKPRKNSELISI